MCGLRDLSTGMVALLALWIHELPQYKRTSFLEPCWMLEASLQLPVSCSDFPFLFFARHSRVHRNFQLSPCVFDGFFIFTIFRIDETNASQPSSIVDFRDSRLPVLASLSSERLFPFWTRHQATNYQVWWLLEFL